MQLLLILSALLSALTGAMSGRAPDLRSHQTTCAPTAQHVAPVRASVVRIAQALPTLAATALAPWSHALGLAGTVPLYATRLRE